MSKCSRPTAPSSTSATTDDEVYRANEELGINISARFETSSIDEI